MKNKRRLIGRLVAVILIIIALLISKYSNAEGSEEIDQSTGLARTGVFHGQMGLQGLKDMIHYLEKALEVGLGTKEFKTELEAALIHAKKALADFEPAVMKAGHSVGIDFSTNANTAK